MITLGPNDVLIAIDPGSVKTGLALFDADGPVAFAVAQAKSKLPVAERLNLIIEGVIGIIHRHLSDRPVPWNQRDIIFVMEYPQYMEGRPGQREVYFAAGALYGALVRDVAIWHKSFGAHLILPATWKKAVIGNGNAGKPEIKEWLKLYWRGSALHKTDFAGIENDAWDALGLATWYLNGGAEGLAS